MLSLISVTGHETRKMEDPLVEPSFSHFAIVCILFLADQLASMPKLSAAESHRNRAIILAAAY